MLTVRGGLAFVMLGLAVLGLAAATGCDASRGSDGPDGSASSSADVVVARVNGKDVTQREVDLRVALAGVEGKRLEGGAALAATIDDRLVRDEAARLGVSAADAVVAERIGAATAAAGGEAGLAAVLGAENVTSDQFDARARDIVLAETLQDVMFDTIAAPRAAAERYYRQHAAEFAIPESVKLAVIQAQTRGPVRVAREEIDAGDSFADAARRHTADELARAEGGMQGWVVADSLPGPLGEAVDDLEPGEVSDPVQGPGGWYLFTIYGRREARQLAFAEVRQELVERLTQERRRKALERWLEGRRASSAVEIL